MPRVRADAALFIPHVGAAADGAAALSVDATWIREGPPVMTSLAGRSLRPSDGVELALSLEGGREIRVRVPVRGEAPR